MFQGHIDTVTAVPTEACADFIFASRSDAKPVSTFADRDGDALFDLGLMFSSGRTGPVDLVAAHKWFNLAALRGRVDAIALRREIAELMSEQDIAAAQREARAWMSAH